MGVHPEKRGGFLRGSSRCRIYTMAFWSQELIPWSFLGVRPLLSQPQNWLLCTLEHDQGETQAVIGAEKEVWAKHGAGRLDQGGEG